jgi:ferredoxin
VATLQTIKPLMVNIKMSQEKLQSKARALLESNAADFIIGYQQGYLPHSTRPIFLTGPEHIDKLVLNPFCYNNLAVYLIRPEIKKWGRPAVVAKTEDIRSIIVLAQEFQIKPEEVIILGFNCEDPGNADAKISLYEAARIEDYETILADETRGAELTGETFEQLAKLEAMSPEERLHFWRKEFSRCIKCYACRAACPLCYCERCIAEVTQPAWIEPSAHLRGNWGWNFARAWHLAGRCVLCGACERACPMGIPLMLLNAALVREVAEKFNYLPGYDTKIAPPLATFSPRDEAAFIR